MNEQFFDLPLEKQQRIINAGFEVFGFNEYKRASTDVIAAKADISKGLLFYYFHNKKTFYLFLFQCAEKKITESVVDEGFEKITDFFELCQYAAIRKVRLLAENPHIMDFICKAFYSHKEEVSEDLNNKLINATLDILGRYFQKVDMTKFKAGVNPIDILQMLTWCADGYLHEQQRSDKSVDMKDLNEKYQNWIFLLKSTAYKEEYL